MNSTATLGIENQKIGINLYLLFFVTMAIVIGITTYYAIDKPREIPLETTVETDIDWTKPPCSPDELSKDWKEVTDPRMAAKSQRRVYQYKDTQTKIAFEKGKANMPGHRAKDHWHRFNPFSKNDRDFYLDQKGNPASRNSDPSHIDTNCK